MPASATTLTRQPESPQRPGRLLLVLLLCLLLLEGSFQLAGAHRFKYWLDYGYGTEQGLRDLAGGTVELYSSANRRFWPRRISAEPAAGVQRIVVVGDSVARGGSSQNNWPHAAEQALNALGCKVEVINLSSGGYGSARKRDLAVMALARLHPQWIIYQASITTEYEDELDRRRRETARAQPWLLEHYSWAALWLKERKFDILYSRWLSPRIREHGGAIAAEEVVAAKTDVAAWYPQVLANSRQIAALASDRGVGFVLAPRLAFDRASGKLNDMRLRELAEQVVGKQRSFDWTAGLGSTSLAPLYADSAHHTPLGNERVGQQLAQWWRRQGLCR